jgi:subtilisin family serine protease
LLIIVLAMATSGLAEGAGPWRRVGLQQPAPTETPTLAEGAGSEEANPTQTPGEDKLEPGLRSAILAAPEGQGDFLVYLTDQADLQPAYEIEDWAERGQFVFDALRDTARTSQAGLLQSLSAQSAAGEVAEYHSYYLVNAIGVTGGVTALDALAARPEVSFIEAVKQYSIPEPIPADAIGTLAVEWGVARIGADQVWAEFGDRGQGIVVASIDTGVLYTHPALINQYRGTVTGSHDYNWFDPAGSPAPVDGNGHGTHTMGTMVGDDGGSNQIGIAPQATWIAAKGCATSSCSSADLLASAEWILAPFPVGGTPDQGDPSMRPQVVNNSWGGPGGDLWYQLSVQAWRAADIFPAFAAGNSGPSSGSIGSPGDYAESFATGATSSSDAIASFSSRGPSSLTSETKPDVSSPGVSVRSAWNNGSYNTISGTSMASPHTAGCVALIRSRNSELDVAQVEDLLTSTALDLGSAGPDTSYGFGRIDCYAAVAAAEPGPTATPGGPTFTPTRTPTPGTPTPSRTPTPGTTTPTRTPTAGTPSLTPTPLTPTATRTPSATPLTPTFTPTRTPSATPLTPTFTPTRTPSATPLTATFTPTRTPSATPLTPTSTWTPRPTPITPTSTWTPTSTPLTPTHTWTPPPTPVTPTVTPGPELLFFDDFETDRGWLRNPSGTDTAITGQWERADPQDTSWFGRLQLGTTQSGTHDLVTGSLAGLGPGDHDVDGGVTSIRSPEISLPAEGDIQLSFFYYMAHLNNSSPDDFLRVQVHGTGSSAVVFEELGSADNDYGAWAAFSTSLNAFAGQTIYLLVEAADAGTPSLVEAAVEDVAITVAVSTPPPSTPAPTDTPLVPTATHTLPPPTHTPTPLPTHTPTPQIIFSDDFETDRGWLGDYFGSDTAITGLWERADPQGTSWGGPLQLDTTTSGTQALVTGALAGSGTGEHDIDGGVTSIRSPDISLPAGGDIQLSFNFYMAHLNNSSPDDFLRVWVFGTGSSGLVVEELGAADNDYGAWEARSVDLSGFDGQTIYVMVEAADAGTPSLVEAAIDDLTIRVGGP